jgi:hypothetical protein
MAIGCGLAKKQRAVSGRQFVEGKCVFVFLSQGSVSARSRDSMRLFLEPPIADCPLPGPSPFLENVPRLDSTCCETGCAPAEVSDSGVRL